MIKPTLVYALNNSSKENLRAVHIKKNYWRFKNRQTVAKATKSKENNII